MFKRFEFSVFKDGNKYDFLELNSNWMLKSVLMFS